MLVYQCTQIYNYDINTNDPVTYGIVCAKKPYVSSETTSVSAGVVSFLPGFKPVPLSTRITDNASVFPYERAIHKPIRPYKAFICHIDPFNA